MANSIVTKIRSMVEGLTSPAYPFLYAEMMEANELIERILYTKICILERIKKGKDIPRGNGIFNERTISINFGQRTELSAPSSVTEAVLESLEQDAYNFEQLVLSDNFFSKIDSFEFSSITNKLDDNLCLVNLTFTFYPMDGLPLNDCE